MLFALRLSTPFVFAASIIAALIAHGSTPGLEALTAASADTSPPTVSACITYPGYVLSSEYKHVESSQLPVAKQQELAHLLHTAQIFQLPREIIAPASRSAYPDDGSPHFIITIVTQDKSHTVSINTAMVEPSKALTPFLQWLEKQALVEGDPGRDGCHTLWAEQPPKRRAFVRSDWQDLYFGPINFLTVKAKEFPLRKKNLPSGEAEIRIWEGFGLMPLEGFLLRQSKKGVSATILRQKPNRYQDITLETVTITDRQRLSQLWNNLTKAGIFELPDSSQSKGEDLVLDGVSYVVEYRRGPEYRTYMYANPAQQSWPEARSIENIVYSVHHAFPPHAPSQ